MTEQKITLGGGCFWCVEAVFLRVKGVLGAVSGYAGGHSANPTYADICTGTSGHAEVVQIRFDETITFKEILEIFWQAHDPTTLNRQGADVGSQYRSVVFCENDKQLQETRESIQELNDSGYYPNPAVTQVALLDNFTVAESDHQDFYNRNTYQGYCRVVIHPKLQKLGLL